MALPRRYLVANYRKGWKGDSERHRLAAYGIATGRTAQSRGISRDSALQAIAEMRARSNGRESPTRSFVDVGQTDEVLRSVVPLEPTAALPVRESLPVVDGRSEVVTADEPNVDIEESVDVSEPDPLTTIPGSKEGMKVMTPGVPPAPSGIGEESAVIRL